jgi:hypothetical protein
VKEPGELWQQRYKVEQLTEVSCPKCGARPGEWCDRGGERLSKHGQSLRKAGTPPSHQERMWTRQGHAEHEFPGLLAKQRPGLWDETVVRPGKPAAHSGGRVGCGPCGRERAIRAGLADPDFPVDFPCMHPAAGPVPAYPQRYQGDRPCPECGFTVLAEVVVQNPKVIGFRCGRGHKWLATA